MLLVDPQLVLLLLLHIKLGLMNNSVKPLDKSSDGLKTSKAVISKTK
jgi:hypothetical protein